MKVAFLLNLVLLVTSGPRTSVYCASLAYCSTVTSFGSVIKLES